MSNTTAVINHGNDMLGQLDPSLFDLDLLHGGALQDHAANIDTSNLDVHFLAQDYLDDLEIDSPEDTTAGISFDELDDSNAQSIGRKFGFLLILIQIVTVIFKGIGPRGGGFAQAYGMGGGIATRLICTVIAVVMLSDFKVIPPIVDSIQQVILWVWNWLVGAIGEDASGSGITG